MRLKIAAFRDDASLEETAPREIEPNWLTSKFGWHFVNFCVQLSPAKFDSQATEGRYRQPASPPH